jgi:hypothetical protein
MQVGIKATVKVGVSLGTGAHQRLARRPIQPHRPTIGPQRRGDMVRHPVPVVVNTQASASVAAAARARTVSIGLSSGISFDRRRRD